LQNLPRSNARLLGQVNDLGDRLAYTLEQLLAVGLRAVTELARLGRRNATSRDRRMMLEPILDVIEGDEETREVRDARALLLELA
jgi:hypothetical protein